MYSESDITGALHSYDSIREEFATLIKEILEIFKEIPRDYEKDTLLKTVEILTTINEKGEEFIEKYRSLRKSFELLGPDEIKLEYFEDYKWLSAIYTYYMKVVIQKPDYDSYVQRYYEKTIKFVHKATEVERLEKELPAIAFDENYLRRLEEKVKDKKEKAANILFALNRFVLVDRHRSPIYESLVERVERLLELWKEKTKDYELLYLEGTRIFNDAISLSERQRALGFSDLDYSILLILEQKLGESDGLVDEVKDISKRLIIYMFSGWINQTTARKEVEREVRKFVRGLKNKHGFSINEMDDLYNKLIESVKNYGAL